MSLSALMDGIVKFDDAGRNTKRVLFLCGPAAAPRMWCSIECHLPVHGDGSYPTFSWNPSSKVDCWYKMSQGSHKGVFFGRSQRRACCCWMHVRVLKAAAMLLLACCQRNMMRRGRPWHNSQDGIQYK